MKIMTKIDLARQLVELGVSVQMMAALKREFPELKESEDERTRKEIIQFFKDASKSKTRVVGSDIFGEWAAYLEKQKDAIGAARQQGYEEGMEDGASMVESMQKKQKPAETSNVDLDTKVNVWVGYTLNNNAQSYSRKEVQIMLDNCARYFYDYAVMCLDKPAEWSEEDEKRVVELKTFIAQCNGFNKANRQKAFELIDALRPQPKAEWTIKDAKPGDILTTGTVTFIFKSVDKDGFVSMYCSYAVSTTGTNLNLSDTATVDSKYVHPASIEQRREFLEELLRHVSSQPHWKPGEGQMEVLLNTEGLVRANNYPESAKILASLYEQLKKL